MSGFFCVKCEHVQVEADPCERCGSTCYPKEPSGFYLCFECDHRQAVAGACQVCRGSCELIGTLDSRRYGRFIVIEGEKSEEPKRCREPQ
jgi:hypothetical protein